MSIPAIEPSGFVPFAPPSVSPTGATTPMSPIGPAGASTGASTGTAETSGVDFADMLAGGLDRLQGMHDRADNLAVQAATGDLSNLHDYTIAATEAAVTTQLTTAVRNKALEAFNEIMRMPI